MCLHLWESLRSRRPARRRSRRPSADHDWQETRASSRTSSPFTSNDPFSISSSTNGSIAGGLAKTIVFPGPFFYKFPEIQAATLNFAASQQMGSSTWKCTLRGSPVAITRKPGAAHNFHKLLRKVCALHHSHLARVLGGCRAVDCIYVGYDLIDGSDLQACLQSTIAPGFTVLSTWRLRMQVALDVAKGLEYVHQHTHSAHKYLTSRNVVLTKENLRAKLALVGMATLTGEVDTIEDEEALAPVSASSESIRAPEQQEGNVSDRKRTQDLLKSVKIRGIHGYMPPEYTNFGEVSQKYDVFTYGVVLLELFKGQGVGAQDRSKAKGAFKRTSIVDEVRSVMEDTTGMKGRLRLWMDSRLKDSYPVEDAVKVVSLALLCVSDNPQKRPRMSKVALQMALFLESAIEWENERMAVTQSGTLQGR